MRINPITKGMQPSIDEKKIIEKGSISSTRASFIEMGYVEGIDFELTEVSKHRTEITYLTN